MNPAATLAGVLAAIAAAVLLPASAAGQEAAGPGPDWTFHGEHRARYESLDAQFRPLLDADDEVLALRTRLTATASWARWGFSAELVDSRAYLNDEGSFLNASIVNAAEPLELVGERRWTGLAGDASATLRFGRLTADLGSRRLLARNNFRNSSNSFAGFDFSWNGGNGRSLRAFGLAPMFALPRLRSDLLDNEPQVDNTTDHTWLAGLAFARDLGPGGDTVEIYGLRVDADEILDRRRLTTLGARISRPGSAGSWHYEVELAAQGGRSSALSGGTILRHLDHAAHFGHADVGYTFESGAAPRLELELDVATGDEDPGDDSNERFDTLFGARRFDFGPTGIFGPFARANLRSSGLRFNIAPREKLDAMVAWRSFRLESSTDAWTTTLLRDPSGQSGDSLGRQLEFAIAWRPRIDRLRMDFGGALLSKGSFISRTAPDLSGTSRYYYVSTTVQFLDAAGR